MGSGQSEQVDANAAPFPVEAHLIFRQFYKLGCTGELTEKVL